MKKRIFFDHAATTPVLPEVAAAMKEVMLNDFGNPSSSHEEGRKAKARLQSAREIIGKAIGAEKEEIFFTSGGTEADFLAIAGIARAARAMKAKGNHLITTSIEHRAVLGAFELLEREGFEVTYLPVGPHGILDPEVFTQALRKETTLASIMTANNEIGTLQAIPKLAQIAKNHGVAFHTDAIQAFPHIHINVQHLKIDALSLSAHKLYGPKGVGALYLKSGTPFLPLVKAGEQERQVRPGTENLPGIVGFSKATEILMRERDQDTKRVLTLRNKLREGLLKLIPKCRLNGDATQRLPNNLNISFDGCDGESLLIQLDLEGIACSMGSACSAGALEPSHVLLNIGCSPIEAKSSIRFTLGKFTQEEDVNFVLDVLPRIVKKLRDGKIYMEVSVNGT